MWADMFIETTFMRFGHSAGGLTGMTVNENATRRWALSLHVCSKLLSTLDDLRSDDKPPPNMHKEEMKACMAADEADRKKLREKIRSHVKPMDPKDHPATLFNVVTGKLADPKVNVQDAVRLGKECTKDYQRKLPDGFHDTISSGCIDLDIQELFSHELAPIPTFLFSDSGEM